MAPHTWLIGNWKMHGDLDLLERFDAALVQRFGRGGETPGVKLGLAVPDLLLYPAMGLLSNLPIELGVQTCGARPSGAHTGETSPALATQLGAAFAILGHSERRQDQGETSASVKVKAEAALNQNLRPIICVGETLEQREAGEAEAVVLEQVRASCAGSGGYHLAYEPVWAIGTGKVAQPEDAQAMHAAIRKILPDPSTPILYGGSMKPDNAAALLAQPDVDGGLIGGASLSPADLLAIYAACA